MPDQTLELDPGLYWGFVEHLPAYGGACRCAIDRLLAEPPAETVPLDPMMSAFLEPGETVTHISAEEMAAMQFR
ncbi:hypothetical protein [Amycolatopsis sp.]|uniref:hypothetical protein n=1 Tax=Amycolatopsis sp. TaxID=37632 RepID=UPI00263A36BE|nr:hypothetical protein [Amycolatopsis sp.]